MKSKEDLANAIIKAAVDANEQSLYELEPYSIHSGIIHELCLCEFDKIIPRPLELYKFVVDESCPRCLALESEYYKED